MLFQNMWLLAGLLTVSIPIIIHLLNRRTPRTVQWGAIQFLLDSMIRCKRRIMLEEVLLLGARCLLLSLVACAVARPFVPPGSHVPYAIVLPLALLAIAMFGASFAMTPAPRAARVCRLAAALMILLAGLAVGLEKKLNLGRFGGAASQSIALVIDGSTSMTVGADGTPNFNRALAEATRLVETAGPGAEFSVILAGSFPVTVIGAPASDRVKVLSALEALKPAAGCARVPAALSAAASALALGFCPEKKIVFLTDGQRAGWETDDPSRWKFVGDTFAKMTPPPDFVLRTLPGPKRFRNAGVAAIDFSREAVGADREVGILVRVENTGSEAVTPSELTLKIGEDVLTDRTIGQIEPGASESIRFPYRFREAGPHTLVARLAVTDDLPADDTCSAAVSVIGSLRVLLIDGHPSSRFLDGAASFAALAMAPAEGTATLAKRAGGADAEKQGADRFLIEPKIVDVLSLQDIGPLAGYDVIVLSDVPQLPSALARDVRAYVRDGGGLLVAPGENARRDFYNGWLTTEGKRLLPADIGTRITAAPGEERRLSLTTLTHRALQSVRDSNRGDIGTLAVSDYWLLGEAAPDEAVSIGARLNNGDAFLAERKVGKGVVLLTACSLDHRGSNLAGLSAFVPLIHEMVYYLSNPSRPNLNVAPGPDIALRLTARPQGKPRDEEARADVLGPDNVSHPARLLISGDGAVVRMGGLQQPGLYRITVPGALKECCGDVLAADGTVPFAVAQEIEESRLQPLGPADVELVRKFTRLSQPATVEEARRILTGKAFGKELWRLLAIAALLLVLVEIGLTRWIVARRGEARGVAFSGPNELSTSLRAHGETIRHAD
jgi:hypothetical protein